MDLREATQSITSAATLRVVATLKAMLALDRRAKRATVVAMDGVLCILAVWIAFSLRLGEWTLGSAGVTYVIVIALIAWYPIAYRAGVYRAIFRFAGSGTIVTLGTSTALMLIPMAAIFLFWGVAGVPRTIAPMQPMIFFILLSLSRIVARYILVDLLALKKAQGQRRALIYGAGSAGRQLASSLGHEPDIGFYGFIDDDDRLDRQHIDGVPVVYSGRLAETIARHRITDIFLAMPSIKRPRRKKIVAALGQFEIRVQTLPAMRDLVDGKVSVTALRAIQVEELLGREPVRPNQLLLARTITGKTVMITGAGGSIGSELCRQIARLNPKRLVLAEMGEFALYAIEQELRGWIVREEVAPFAIEPELVNVVNRDSIDRVMERTAPDTVFHAAAYKHVPLVEANVVGGARNNIIGTYHTALAAERAGVQHFVLISTDKAVRPTNVMGATKRICELILQAFAARGSKTIFAMVRFGNVLGSSGSVVPLFTRQIAEGGPVTVTDRRITRFFMTIPEASQLVIQAGAMATGGDVYVLEMGEPIRIRDLAETMIRLSGMTERSEQNPDGDIEIVEIGLRPGEKLYEELLIGDNPQKTRHPRIMHATERMVPYDALMAEMEILIDAIARGDRITTRGVIERLVPEYSAAAIAVAL